jgi:hypothetical protein
MADGGAALQAADHAVMREIVGDMTHRAVGMEILAIVADDAGCFLAAVLQGMEAQNGAGGGFFDTKDADNAALLLQFVVIEGIGREHRHLPFSGQVIRNPG